MIYLYIELGVRILHRKAREIGSGNVSAGMRRALGDYESERVGETARRHCQAVINRTRRRDRAWI